jgi:hypothetical protein
VKLQETQIYEREMRTQQMLELKLSGKLPLFSFSYFFCAFFSSKLSWNGLLAYSANYELQNPHNSDKKTYLEGLFSWPFKRESLGRA